MSKRIDATEKQRMDFDKHELSLLFIEFLSEKYGISGKELMDYIRQKKTVVESAESIPISIFKSNLGPKEAIVKYLKENLNKRYVEIASIVGRDQRSVWNTYRKAKEKHPAVLTAIPSRYDIPFSAFGRKDLSALEGISLFLKENFSLSFKHIGRLLDRDERTVWTVYRRAVAKNG